MKKTLLSLLSISIVAAVSAQQTSNTPFIKAPAYVRNMAKPYNNHKLTGFEAMKQLVKKPNPTVMHHDKSGSVNETIIGGTTYDLQTNSSIEPRTINKGSENIFAAWIYSNTGDLAASDRGTGYNNSNAGTWNANPTSRIENVRTGWPSLGILSNNKEIAVSHAVSGPLHMAYRTTAGTGTWNDTTIATNTGTTLLWPRMAVSGTNIYVIALTEPTANQGTVYKGLDGALLYYRSQDGGLTWNIQDSIIPGTDSTACRQFSGDGYAISAKDSIVVIAVFNSLAPSFILKSTNYGSTWTKTTYLNTGLPSTYSAAAAGSISDTNSDGIADTISSTDQSGAILIDNSGIVHLTFGNMRYLDDDATSGAAWSYFPGTSGLLYWDETMPTDSVRLIADALDLNNNQTLDIDTPIAKYQVSLTGFPSIGMSSNGTLFITYSGIVETLSNGTQNYRHLYAIKSNDNGLTWTAPTDLTFGFINNFNECVYACLAPTVDDKLHVVFQQDGEPGTAAGGDADAFGNNDIIYLDADTSAIGDTTLAVQQITKKINGISVFPNPANNKVTLTFNANIAGQVNISLYNIVGKQIAQIENKNTQKGTQRVIFNVSNLPAGIYFVKVKQADNSVETQKIVVQ